MSTRPTDVTWHGGRVTRERRAELLGHRGATVWFTGLPSSGKSTLAASVEERLLVAGRPAYLLDGDNLRHGLNQNLGFSVDDRAENVRRVGEVARLLADAGVVALASVIAPYAATRDRVRKLHEDDGLHFTEVFVNTPAEECERRDPKGLWARARAGEIKGFTGVDAPYEPPAAPDLEITPETAPDAAVQAVLAALGHKKE